MDSTDRASGYFTTHADTHPKVNTRTSGVYLRADPGDMAILDGRDDRQRVRLIAERLKNWKSIATRDIAGTLSTAHGRAKSREQKERGREIGTGRREGGRGAGARRHRTVD